MKKCKILILISMLLLFLAGCGKKEEEINLTEFVSVSYTGFNGKAKANINFDFPSFEEVIISKVDSEDISVMQLAVLEESIKLEADKKESISNGDTINVSVSWNDELAKNIGVKLTGSEIVVEVSAIEEAKEIDLFKDIVIDYSGESPYATASVRNTSSDYFLSSMRYTIENSGNIANGDEIKVIADCDVESAEEKGYIITETEHTFIAEGIDYYITEYSEIDEETFQKMDSQARDLIESRLASHYDSMMYPDNWYIGLEYDEIVSIDLTNAYFFVLKEGLEKDYSSVGNSIFLIYTVTTKDERSPEGKVAYIPVYFKDFILRDTGMDVVITDGYITSTYDVYDNLFRNIVTVNKEKYSYEEITY